MLVERNIGCKFETTKTIGMGKLTLTHPVEPTRKDDLEFGFDSTIQIGATASDFINVFHSNEDECKRITALVLNADELLEAAKEALSMYRSVQPAGGWQYVEDGLIEAIKNAQP